MVEPLSVTERVNEASVCFLVLVIPFDGIVKVSLDFEQDPKVGILRVQRLVDFMISDEYYLHIQWYWLRDQGLSAANSKPLPSLLNQDASALQNSLQSVVGELVLEKLNGPKDEIASISPVNRASLDEGEVCCDSSESRFVLELAQQIGYCRIVFRYYWSPLRF